MMKVCAGLALVFWMTMILSAQDQDPIEVVYHARTITAERGSTVKLTCVAKYNFEFCKELHVVWHTTDRKTELTDPKKYFTTISEKHIGVGVRERIVITEILRVTPRDSERYQCKADCNGQIAMGHFITVNVTGESLH